MQALKVGALYFALVALALVLAAAVGLREMSPGEWLLSFATAPGLAALLLFRLFAAMPALFAGRARAADGL